MEINKIIRYTPILISIDKFLLKKEFADRCGFIFPYYDIIVNILYLE